MTSNDLLLLFLLLPSPSLSLLLPSPSLSLVSRGVWFLLCPSLLRVLGPLAGAPGPSPVLDERLSSEVAWASSGLACLCRSKGPAGGAVLSERLLRCLCGCSGRGDGGGNRGVSLSRARERRRAALTTMFCTPFRICSRSVCVSSTPASLLSGEESR